ncbi:MAG: alpha/beta hydrolase [Alcanivorax sp.]|nr:alpha/beta hydrolase [Alcanivorax sp.]
MISLQAWRAQGETFNYQGWPVFTRRGGNPQGPALLLIHGFPTASWDWNKVWPLLGKRYALYTLDMLGFGDSAKPKRFAYRIQDQADLIEAWLQQAGVQDYHVLAHDYGDTVAQELLARHLERQQKDAAVTMPVLHSVCFLNGGIIPETHRALPIQKLLLSPVGPLLARLTSKKRLAANLTAVFGPDTPPSDEEIDTFYTLASQNGGLAVTPKLLTYMPQRRRHRQRWVGALCNTPLPVKLINGPQDPVSGGHMVSHYRDLVPDADITLLKGIGHYPQMEDPQMVVDAYLKFRAHHKPKG